MWTVHWYSSTECYTSPLHLLKFQLRLYGTMSVHRVWKESFSKILCIRRPFPSQRKKLVSFHFSKANKKVICKQPGKGNHWNPSQLVLPIHTEPWFKLPHFSCSLQKYGWLLQATLWRGKGNTVHHKMCGFFQLPQLIGKLMKVQEKVTQTLINPLSTCRTLCPGLICWEERLNETSENLPNFI